MKTLLVTLILTIVIGCSTMRPTLEQTQQQISALSAECRQESETAAIYLTMRQSGWSDYRSYKNLIRYKNVHNDHAKYRQIFNDAIENREFGMMGPFYHLDSTTYRLNIDLIILEMSKNCK